MQFSVRSLEWAACVEILRDVPSDQGRTLQSCVSSSTYTFLNLLNIDFLGRSRDSALSCRSGSLLVRIQRTWPYSDSLFWSRKSRPEVGAQSVHRKVAPTTAGRAVLLRRTPLHAVAPLEFQGRHTKFFRGPLRPVTMQRDDVRTRVD